ncbi:MAG: hypothetical protein RLZZ237_1164 [Pseudomonadota bacterium]|jgi:hypothetical protein
MKHIRISALLGASLLAFSSLASAQFGGLAGALGGGKGVTAEQIVKKYVAGTQSVMQADASMLAAFGLKEQSDKAALEAQNLTEGATKDSLQDASKLQSDSSKLLEEQMKGKKVAMDDASKKRFTDGLIDLSKGVIQYVGMGKDVGSFKPSMSSLGASANSALFIGQNLPTSIKAVSNSLKVAIDFAKNNNIPLPKEASEATSLL